MIRIRKGNVLDITFQRKGYEEIIVDVEGTEERAVNYPWLTGPVHKGDTVFLNTTAVAKNLGTGGVHFVMCNTANESLDAPQAGHIMKLRYTPAQVKVRAVEEEENPVSRMLRGKNSLDGMPVVIASLHSMLGPVAAVIKKLSGGKLKIVYIMTDGGALPLPLSHLVHQLRERKLIDTVITCGHAFGGDLEAVNIYSGLLAGKEIAGADVAVVAMGPGIVGTASEFGFTGVEQGEIVNAVNVLEGKPIAVPRISFADKRDRHRGVSHHTLTALGRIALTKAVVCVPVMEEKKARFVEEQLKTSGITEKHQVMVVDGLPVLDAVKEYNLKVKTMGRGVDNDLEFFLAAGAAGVIAVSCSRNVF